MSIVISDIAHALCSKIIDARSILRAEGLAAIRFDARHARAAMDTAANKIEANDADGLWLLAWGELSS